jgi:hypothetical protein
MSLIASRKTGAPTIAPIRKRRVMATNSGFGPSSRPTVRGSSAMPHFGQAPGSDCQISGSIGQT